MKKMLIVCGTGIATSTVVIGKIKNWLEANSLSSQVKIYQGNIAEEINRFDDYDIIISTTLVPENYKDRVINGIALLTGVGTEEMYERIKKEIEG